MAPRITAIWLCVKVIQANPKMDEQTLYEQIKSVYEAGVRQGGKGNKKPDLIDWENPMLPLWPKKK